MLALATHSPLVTVSHHGVTVAVNPHLNPPWPLPVLQGCQPVPASRDLQGYKPQRMPLKDAALVLTEFISLGCPDKSQLAVPSRALRWQLTHTALPWL